MVAVAPGSTIGANSPVLITWIVDAFGRLCAPDSLAWTIYDVSTDEKDMSPVQVATDTVDLEADRVSEGCYAVAWTVPSGTGRRRITWSATVTGIDQEGNEATKTHTWSRDFDVLTGASHQPGYCLVSDMRAEGVAEARVSDAWLVKRIWDASNYIDRVTGRWFGPRACEWKIDGNWKPELRIEAPIIGIETMRVFGDGVVGDDLFKVYNRHLSGLLAPDDRNAPKVEFFVSVAGLQGPIQPLAYPYPISSAWMQARVWPKGTQNVTVSGVFGYTDPDGSPEGCTPSEIVRVCKLLVMRNLPKMGRAQDRLEALNAHRVTSERTREQSYTMAAERMGTGAFTSDLEIDSVLEMYMRPLQIAVV